MSVKIRCFRNKNGPRKKHIKVDEILKSSTSVLFFHFKNTVVNVWDLLHQNSQIASFETRENVRKIQGSSAENLLVAVAATFRCSITL